MQFIFLCGLSIFEIAQHAHLSAPGNDFSTMDSDKATSHKIT